MYKNMKTRWQCQKWDNGGKSPGLMTDANTFYLWAYHSSLALKKHNPWVKKNNTVIVQIEVPHTKCWLSTKSFDVKAALKQTEKLGQYCKDWLKLVKKLTFIKLYSMRVRLTMKEWVHFLLRSGGVRLPEKIDKVKIRVCKITWTKLTKSISNFQGGSG